MNEPAIYADLTEIFHEIFNDDSIVLKPETTAEDIEEWDSFHHLALVVAIEGRFEIKFEEEEIVSLTNVRDLVGLIETKTSA